MPSLKRQLHNIAFHINELAITPAYQHRWPNSKQDPLHTLTSTLPSLLGACRLGAQATKYPAQQTWIGGHHVYLSASPITGSMLPTIATTSDRKRPSTNLGTACSATNDGERIFKR
jgi:hypothetical protein